MSFIIDLPTSQEAALSARATAQGISVEEYTRGLIDRDLTPENNGSVFEAIRELWKDVPEDVLATLPVDGASEHDHYLYGTPKKNQ